MQADLPFQHRSFQSRCSSCCIASSCGRICNSWCVEERDDTTRCSRSNHQLTPRRVRLRFGSSTDRARIAWCGARRPMDRTEPDCDRRFGGCGPPRKTSLPPVFPSRLVLRFAIVVSMFTSVPPCLENDATLGLPELPRDRLGLGIGKSYGLCASLCSAGNSPVHRGGLGTACYGLTKAMSGIGTDVMFVLPGRSPRPFSTHVRLISPHPVRRWPPHHRVPSGRVRTRHVSDRRRPDDRPVPVRRPTRTVAPRQPRRLRRLSWKKSATVLCQATPVEMADALPAAPAPAPATPKPARLPASSATPPCRYTAGIFSLRDPALRRLGRRISRTESFEVVHATIG